MTESLATEIAMDYMRQKGLKRKHYMFRFRHLRLDSGEKRVLRGENHLLILLQISLGIKVQSKTGVFEWQDQTIDEMQHVHGGLTWLTNTGNHQSDIYFLQVIPKHKKAK